jgi:hypothetical protein
LSATPLAKNKELQMGVYLYTLRAKTTNVEINGSVTPVHHMKYAVKPSVFGEDEAVETRYINAACRVEKKSQYFMLAGDKGHVEGEPVYQGDVKFWYDGNSLKATQVGVLKRKGRGWTVG